MREVDDIGRIVIEFNEQDSDAVEKIVCAVNRHPAFEELWLSNDEVLCLSEFEIYPGRRKVYCYGKEIELKAKEFDLLCLLVVNKGYVLTYTQIYEKLWGQDSLGNENNSVGCHVRSLRRKLYKEYPNTPFIIRCFRSIGYCLETKL